MLLLLLLVISGSLEKSAMLLLLLLLISSAVMLRWNLVAGFWFRFFVDSSDSDESFWRCLKLFFVFCLILLEVIITGLINLMKQWSWWWRWWWIANDLFWLPNWHCLHWLQCEWLVVVIDLLVNLVGFLSLFSKLMSDLWWWWWLFCLLVFIFSEVSGSKNFVTFFAVRLLFEFTLSTLVHFVYFSFHQFF